MKRLPLVLLAVAAACSDKTMELAERTTTTVGSNGGSALSADGKVTLQFPAGALSGERQITIETRRGMNKPRLKSLVYEFGPSGTTFSVPVTIIIDAPNTGVELAIANLDGPYPEILETSTWDSATGKARATLEHFSLYGVVEIYNPCRGLVCDDACTICDPLDTSCTEPAPNPKVCNRSGLCVEAAIVMCLPPPDAGVFPDATAPDAQETPDSGEHPDAGAPDAEEPADSGVVTCNQTFQQNPQPIVDILIVMDDSCSMFEEQQTLASSFNLLLQTLTQNNTDFHIGVTSTDVDATGAQGQLIGTPTFLSSTTPNLSQVFATHVSLGTNGSGFEQGLEASRLALQPGANPGFLRAESSLVVLYVSDEMDQSPDMPGDYAGFLMNLRGANRVQANAIVGDVPAGCSGPGGMADQGVGYDIVRNLTGGAFSSICAPPWSQALTDLGGSSFGYLSSFTITANNVIEVLVDGVVLPQNGTGGMPNWTFDAASQTVTFSPLAIPEPGAEITMVSGC